MAASRSGGDGSSSGGGDDDSLCDYLRGVVHVVAPACIGCSHTLTAMQRSGRQCAGWCCVRNLWAAVVCLCVWFQRASPKQRLALATLFLAGIAVMWWYAGAEVVGVAGLPELGAAIETAPVAVSTSTTVP